MKWSQGYLHTLREAPSDAEIESHKLMLRAGLIRKVAPGIFTYGHLALRALRQFEQIIREELDKANCIEILMPMVQPRELWEESGRYEKMGAIMARFTNRNGHDFVLGGTHEEVISDFVRKDIKSYRQLPVTLYQIQNKFRDEIRPRFGLMRGREFLMKDAYSFDRTKEEALQSYEKMRAVYQSIFDRLGVNYRMVQADSGDIGGDISQEFHVLAGSGEDALLVGENDFAANVEVCPTLAPTEESVAPSSEEMEEFSTPGLRTISSLAKSLDVGEDQLVKTMFFSKSSESVQAFAVLCRGDHEINLVKLKKVLGLKELPTLLNDHEVKKITGADPGSCGPVGLTCPVYMDHALKYKSSMIVGANKNDFHLKNVKPNRDFKVEGIGDFRMAKEGDPNPEGPGTLKQFRGIEVGHIFYLGQVYSKPLQAQFLDESGKLKDIEMGCYGIGVSRTIQAVIEQSHDKDGIIWPPSLAPFLVHICLLDPKDEETLQYSQDIYNQLTAANCTVLMDDREERPGIKFKDADLLGMPLRLVIGSRGLKEGKVEWVERASKEKQEFGKDEILSRVLEWAERSRNLKKSNSEL